MVEADTRFTGEPEPTKTTEERIKPRNVGIIMAITALVAPIMVNISSYPWEGLYLYMVSVFFVLNYSASYGFEIYPTIFPPWGYPDIIYIMSMSMMLAVYAGPRFVFSYQMVRLYKVRTTKKRAIILGIITDCYILFLMFPNLIAMLLSPSGFFFAALPIPIVLLVALILIKVRPPPVVLTPWKELDEPDKWWDKKEAAPMTSPPQKQSTGTTTEEKTPIKPEDGSWWEEEEKDKKPSKEPTSPW